MIPKNELEQHFKEQCPLYPSCECPNTSRGCQETMIRNEIRFHLKRCEYRDTPCIFQPFGCNAAFSKSGQDAHMRDGASLHTQILLQQIIELQTDVKALKEENRELKLSLTTLSQTQSPVNTSTSTIPLTSSQRPRPQQITVTEEKQQDNNNVVGKLAQSFEQMDSVSKAENAALLSPKKK